MRVRSGKLIETTCPQERGSHLLSLCFKLLGDSLSLLGPIQNFSTSTVASFSSLVFCLTPKPYVEFKRVSPVKDSLNPEEWREKRQGRDLLFTENMLSINSFDLHRCYHHHLKVLIYKPKEVACQGHLDRVRVGNKPQLVKY